LRSGDPCWCGSRRKLKRCHGDADVARRPAVQPGDLSPVRSVPDTIVRPAYVHGPKPRSDTPLIHSGADLERLRTACRVAAEVLLELGAAVAPGVTTDQLDAIAHAAYVRRGAYPSDLGYGTYTKSLCTSVNEVVCHGIPDSRPLQRGDIINLDVTAFIEGMHGDTSATFAVGGVEALDAPTAALVDATCEATLRGIRAVRPGGHLADIGRAIEGFANQRGLGVVLDYGGHGIGAVFHAPPHVSHTPRTAEHVVFVPGMTFTVEPMLTLGTHRHRLWPDGWTVVTEDGLPSAQFEHTVIVTEDGVEILTVTADGRTAVAPLQRAAG
jgi:methionyl aminopeptidase